MLPFALFFFFGGGSGAGLKPFSPIKTINAISLSGKIMMLSSNNNNNNKAILY